MVKYLLIKMRNRKFELHLIIQKDILFSITHYFHYIACNKKTNKIIDKKITDNSYTFLKVFYQTIVIEL